MLKTEEMTIPALTGDETRNIYIYVPDREGSFPVLYMFDGHNVFLDETATYGKSWGMLEYLEANSTPLIVVGIECSHHKETDACGGRLSEYSPFDFAISGAQIKGRGKLTMDWIVQVLKPKIDREYPTLRNRENTWIAGSSMGGLMTLYALSRYGSVFSKGAALSPAFIFSPKQVLEMIRRSTYSDTVLYMDAGEKELRTHGREVFTDVAAALIRRKVRTDIRIVPDGEHNEASWEKQIPFFMQVFFYERQES